MTNPTRLHAVLKKHFGFDEFRPFQQEIIESALDNRDLLALLPTGGGKSLCYQLPALVRDGLTVVVSPLIALMKDQVDALEAAGVRATFLNSSLNPGESARRLRGLSNGEFKLLYVAPERLVLKGFLDDLKKWNVQQVAIDEAHCISEWGHDFRPDYRQLVKLREAFPTVPYVALTATATERVRKDIIRQLQLREPTVFVASFNRSNLNYRVVPKAQSYAQILQIIRDQSGESGIIYCHARKSTESFANRLRADGISATAYHAGLSSEERSRNQEAFLRDEVQVVCATIAFGMGINKSNVRFVVHADLPKNIESYYQETGRAGRDGLPSDCVLMFSPGDRVKQLRFIDEKQDAREREIALSQLEQMVHYAEDAGCRRRQLLGYFGEDFSEANCGACDNCLNPREQWDGTIAAQKFLSCVVRVQQKGGFSVGINHIVEILTGASTEKIRRFQHDQLSTYGIGSEHTRKEWSAIARELVRMGFLRQNPATFNTVELTTTGSNALRSRQQVMLTRPMKTSDATSVRQGAIACDEELFAALRQLRKRIADERGVPPYVIFSDVTLRHMARQYPLEPATLGRVSGVGAVKLRDFGTAFINEIQEFLREHERKEFDPAPAVVMVARAAMNNTAAETLTLFRAGDSIKTIASRRKLKESTILSHLATAIEAGEAVDIESLVSKQAREEIQAAFAQLGLASLSRVHEALNERHDYGQLKLVRAQLLRDATATTAQRITSPG
jgi:ATP-dependent DNA helicase RecQ